MGVLWPDWGRIHHGESPGFWSPLLTVFSILYGAAVRFRVTIYKRRGFKKKILPGFVVSIGNLTAGGTGKTPAVVMLARWALNQGYRVAVLTRGYGRLSKAKVLEVSDGEVIKADCRESGDEPYLLAKKLTGVPVIISSKRFTAGTFAHRKFGANFFILDDGFQHLGLKRDLDLVLIDAIRPFGNGHLLPWGPLREPIDQLARAGALILTRFSNQNSTQRTTYLLNEEFPEVPIFYADHKPERVVFPQLNESHKPDFLKGKRVLAFAGIARPEVFRETITKLGANIVYFKGFRDHYRFKPKEIQSLIKMRKELGAQYLLTSEKDWVRMTTFAPMCPEMAYLSVKFTLVSDQDKFFKMILRSYANSEKPRTASEHIGNG
jgi:tetraacyldisaccharide 4'-kinase